MVMILAFVAVYLLWVYYLACMALLRAHRENKITPLCKMPGYITLLIGLVLDVLVNLLVMTVVFMDFPRELLFTSRLKRLRAHGTWYRQWLAGWCCRHYLNPFDMTGDHCD